MTQWQLVPELLNLRKHEREESNVTKEGNLSWPLRQALLIHALLPSYPPHLSYQVSFGGNTRACVLLFNFTGPGTQTCPYIQCPSDSWTHSTTGKSPKNRQDGGEPDTKLSTQGDTVLAPKAKDWPREKR